MILGVALHRASDRKFSNAKNGDARRKEGAQSQKERTEKKMVFTFRQIHHGDYGGAPMTPAPVAMFE